MKASDKGERQSKLASSEGKGFAARVEVLLRRAEVCRCLPFGFTARMALIFLGSGWPVYPPRPPERQAPDNSYYVNYLDMGSGRVSRWRCLG